MLAACLQYWRDPRIHNLGNVGAGGALHALLAPLATGIIDSVAYKGRDVRRELLRAHVPAGSRVVDLCCGVGTATVDVGVDTSPQMIEMARRIAPPTRSFEVGNAETWGDADSFDVATVFFALHEMPEAARATVVANAHRLARERVLVVDIAPGYTPSPSMLMGEPYVLDYLDKVRDELRDWEHYVVADTVGVWVRDASSSSTIREPGP
jgi:SAM-dependent methyltransferase